MLHERGDVMGTLFLDLNVLSRKDHKHVFFFLMEWRKSNGVTFSSGFVNVLYRSGGCDDE